MHKAKSLPLLLIVATLATGCSTIIPGSHFSNSYGTVVDQYHDQDEDLTELVDIYPITPGLIRDLQPASAKELTTNDSELQKQIAKYEYRVGPGDVLSITVWEHPELTSPAGEYRSSEEAGNWVHSDGTIFYPYIGRVQVNGLNVVEIRELLASKLSQFLEDPQVDVTIAAFRSKWVYVTGEVEQPGTLPLTHIPLTMLDAVNKVGGITAEADWQKVLLARGKQRYEFSLHDLYKEGDISQNILLQANDVVHVVRSDDSKVFVLGEVKQNQTMPLGRNGKTLAEILSDAGGLSQTTANASGVFVFRKAPQGSGRIADVYQLNAKNMAAFILADSFQLQERDIVYVTAAPVVRWNRVLAQLMPTISGIYSLDRLGNSGD